MKDDIKNKFLAVAVILTVIFTLCTYAIQNIKDPNKWAEKCLKNSVGTSKKSLLSKQEIIEEFVLMGLRTKNGINIKDLQKNIDCNSLYDILNKKNIDFLVKNNFISANDNEIKILDGNFNLLNSIIEKIVL